MSLAEEHYNHHFANSESGSYTADEARDVLAGRLARDEAREVFYARMLDAGSTLIAASLNIERNSSQLVIHTLADGESSASARPFADGSFSITVSHALLDAIVTMANMMMMFENMVSSARDAFTRGGRERGMRDAAFALSAAMRTWIILQRLTGTTQTLSFDLSRADSEAAGAIALEALQFVLAHEIAHIGLNHTQVAADTSAYAGHISQSQVRELQADNLAVRMVRSRRPDPAADAEPMWSVFLALLATEITESAVYIRRNSTHPLAWARWGTLEQMLGGGQSRAKSYQLAILAAFAAAIELDEGFPTDGWTAMKRAKVVTARSIDAEQLVQRDHLLTEPVGLLAQRADASSGRRGREVLALLRDGHTSEGLAALGARKHLLQAVADDRSAVTFFTIKKLIDAACAHDALSPDSLLYSVTGTRLVARMLTEEIHGG